MKKGAQISIFFLLLLTGLIFGFSNARLINLSPPTTITSGLVAYYPFDGNTNDDQGTSHGTTLGNPTYASGIFGQAMNFDGIDDCVTMGNPAVLNNLGPYSVSLWLKPSSSTTGGYVVSKRGASTGAYWRIDYSNQNIGWFKNTGVNNNVVNAISLSPLLSAGQWNHLVLTWDGTLNAGAAKIFINGVEASYSSQNAGQGTVFDDSASPFTIGCRAGTGTFYPGLIDEVGIYNRVLSTSEVSSLYVEGSVSLPSAVCGNTLREGTEVCDGATQSCTLNGYGGTQTCNNQCSGWNTCITTLRCGDTMINGAETCDDGNLVNGDGCSNACTIELGQTATITLNPSTRYQTMKDWEVVSYAIQDDPNYVQFKDKVLDNLVTGGITRIRLEARSGIENSYDYYADFLAAGLPNTGTAYTVWRGTRYATVNDNNDPNTINWGGFKFTDFDRKMDNVIVPLRQKYLAAGKSLKINLNYVAFTSQIVDGGSYHHDTAAEYAEFILAFFLHMQTKYGFTPDGVEIILEPDNVVQWQSGITIAHALLETKRRLDAAGFTNLEYYGPSNTASSGAINYFNQMMTVPGIPQALTEFSFHPYRGNGGPGGVDLVTIGSLRQQTGIPTSMLEWWATPNNYKYLHELLKVAQVSSYQQGAITGTGSGGVSFSKVDLANPSTADYSDVTKYTMLYYQSIKKGAQRIAATSSDSRFDPLAFINADGTYVVIAMATSAGTFSIGGLPAGTYEVRTTTSTTNYNVISPDITLSAGQVLGATMPGTGVIVIRGKTGQGIPTQTCGNSIIEETEVCDSGNQLCTLSGYSGTQTCNAGCTAWNTCTTTQRCGDLVVNGNEFCDGNTVSCLINGNLGTQTCNTLCTALLSCIQNNLCGDGALNVNEQCDDGNNVANDGCSSTCTLEVPLSSNTFDGTTTDITTITDLRNVNSFTLERTTFGNIKFLEPVDFLANNPALTKQEIISSIQQRVTITDKKIIVDSTNLPELNKKARLAMKGITFIQPKIMKDNNNCPVTECIVESYTNGELIFTIEGFSEYSIIEGYVAPALDSEESNSGGGGGGGSGGSSGKGSNEQGSIRSTQTTSKETIIDEQQTIADITLEVNNKKNKYTSFEHILGVYVALIVGLLVIAGIILANKHLTKQTTTAIISLNSTVPSRL